MKQALLSQYEWARTQWRMKVLKKLLLYVNF